MTICIGTMCDNQFVLGASDRMLTAGDVQFQPQQTKIVRLTTSIALMTAGDSAVQGEILLHLIAYVNEQIAANPDKWLGVEHIADVYKAFYNDVRMRKAEQAVLAPLGLDIQTFKSCQQQMSVQLVSQLAKDLIGYPPLWVEVIVAGVDSSGPHLFVVRNGKVDCHDVQGFASIGVGSWHADSQLMLNGHTKHKGFAETLFLTYLAKKRAEVAPGVGEETDMFVIGPGLGTYIEIYQTRVRGLESIYRKTVSKERRAVKEARNQAQKYVEALLAAATAKTQGGSPKDAEMTHDAEVTSD